MPKGFRWCWQAPSQTWRTLLANHFSQLTCTSPAMFCGTPDEDDGVAVCAVVRRAASASGERSCVSDQWSVVHWPLALQRTPVDGRIGQAHAHHRRLEHPSSGTDPPHAQAVPFDPSADRRAAPFVRRLHEAFGASKQFRAIPLPGRWMPRPLRDFSACNHVVSIVGKWQHFGFERREALLCA